MKESHARAKPLIFLDARHKLSQRFIELYTRIDHDVPVTVPLAVEQAGQFPESLKSASD